MPTVQSMPKPTGIFAPWRKTGHFLLLLLVIDLAVGVAIYFLSKPPCLEYSRDSECYYSIFTHIVTVIGRIGALMFANAILLSVYAGLKSFLYGSRALGLIILSLFLMFFATIATLF